MERTTILYVVADFINLRECKFYYMDKTSLIPGLENYNAPILLRPRRFGKSLLVSTLACYCDRTKADRFEELFGGTQVGEHPTEEHSRYIVVRCDFSAMVVADNMEGLERGFNRLNCSPVEIMVTHSRGLFQNFQFTTKGSAPQMPEEVLGYTRGHDLPKVYILTDEYDNFTNQLLTTYKDPLYEQVTTKDSFLRTFFKVIKKGISGGSIRACFCADVLPVTMDDLTSGYNVVEILTLQPRFLNMLGLTYEKANTYLGYVINKYGMGQDPFEGLWQLIVNSYDGYRFHPGIEPLSSSTVLTYFFKNFAALNGFILSELVNENLCTDISWIRRLTLSMEDAKEVPGALIINDELSYNIVGLSSEFNKKRFFDRDFYPVSLFCLGMATLRNNYHMVLPNLTMYSIYVNYYNKMNHIEGGTPRYVPTCERFAEDRRFEPLVQDYFEQYLGQFPAQVFDKIDENFIRCSFFELCSHYLSSYYTFAIKQNNSADRSGFEMTGTPGTDYYKNDRIMGLKCFKVKEAGHMPALNDPRPEDVAQVRAYAKDTKLKFPIYNIHSYIVYICTNKGWKCWEVTE